MFRKLRLRTPAEVAAIPSKLHSSQYQACVCFREGRVQASEKYTSTRSEFKKDVSTELVKAANSAIQKCFAVILSVKAAKALCPGGSDKVALRGVAMKIAQLASAKGVGPDMWNQALYARLRDASAVR